jgi:hypothetical protein
MHAPHRDRAAEQVRLRFINPRRDAAEQAAGDPAIQASAKIGGNFRGMLGGRLHPDPHARWFMHEEGTGDIRSLQQIVHCLGKMTMERGPVRRVKFQADLDPGGFVRGRIKSGQATAEERGPQPCE